MNTLTDATFVRNSDAQHQADEKLWSSTCKKATLSGSRYALFQGDSTTVLSKVPASSVDTCLTSPPYWSVRDYGSNDQIGLEDSVDEYIDRLVKVFRQVHRTLKPNGTAWLNLGDCYINGAKVNDPAWKRNKQLALIPFRVAIELQNDGWWVRNTLVWHKPNAMPSSARDRLTNAWEPVFLLTKSERYHFNLDALRVPHKTTDHIERKRAVEGDAEGKAKGQDELRRWLNSPRHRATIDGLKEVRRRPNAPQATELAAYLRSAAEKKGLTIKDVAAVLQEPFERVRHYFRTDQVGSRRPPEKTWSILRELLSLDSEYDEAMSVEIGDNVFRNHPNGRNPGDMQSFSLTGSTSDAQGHFAVMPPSLADWCLKATLPEGGVCIDPFLGIGTTGHSALKLGGRIVGSDVRGDYLQYAADAFTKLTEPKPIARGKRKA